MKIPYQNTLRGYLHTKRLELYAYIEELQDLKENVGLNPQEETNLSVAQGQLDIIKSVISICDNRRKY